MHLVDIIKYWKEYQDIASKEMKEQVLKTFKESAGRYNKKQEDLAYQASAIHSNAVW